THSCSWPAGPTRSTPTRSGRSRTWRGCGRSCEPPERRCRSASAAWGTGSAPEGCRWHRTPQPTRNRTGSRAAPTYGPGAATLGPMDTVLDLTRYSVRDGRLAPVTCVACGCRLEQRSGRDGWFHFESHDGRDGRDARGCIVECAERAHYSTGTILAEAS